MTTPHRELAADALAEDEDGLQLLRAAAAAAADPSHLLAAVPHVLRLSAEWSENYFDRPIDDAAYASMAADETRTPLFAAAIRRRLHGRSDWVVLDIGTGPFCLLALLAARAGARRVFAVEANAAAAARARQAVQAAEASGEVPVDVVEVLSGFSTEVTLPERADLLVAELVRRTAEVCAPRTKQLHRSHDSACARRCCGVLVRIVVPPPHAQRALVEAPLDHDEQLPELVSRTQHIPASFSWHANKPI